MEIAVFILGAGAYGTMELIFRGYTHWSMLLTGGACVLTIYYIQGWLFGLPVVLAALAGAFIITAYEFFVGVLVNLQFGWHVWDYSALPGNILGQICPAFTAVWFCVCKKGKEIQWDLIIKSCKTAATSEAWRWTASPEKA